ncbi:DUF1840 domain-containing protein [Marinobacterium jannaschii]|uniref:DUF1840 domain-containing protein n=1 Tax=Marinobacterium jannaschii TaxID=64970 RepID=UPI00048898EB|nr:DUF1840 domain-containing protein [Marinobacterium jannaschii]
MLITFKSEAYANITMFGDVGLSLLKLMGYSAVPGSILAEDVPEALQRLKSAVVVDKIVQPQAIEDNADSSTPVNVSLAKRAIPLLEMLTAAAADECDVMWDK